MNRKIPMCGGLTGSTSRVSDSVEIWFDGSPEAFVMETASKGCQCNLKNPGPRQDLTMTIIDLRFERYKATNNSGCSSAKFNTSVFAARCVPTKDSQEHNFYRERQLSLPLYEGGTSEIILSNLYVQGRNDSPSIVWIKIQGKSYVQSNGRDIQLSMYMT